MERNKLTFLLIHPEISRTRYNFVGVIENECLELEYISSGLQNKGHEVFIYDGQVETMGVPMALDRYKPDVVYVCGRTRQENFMLEYCKEAKDFNENTITIIGGLHAQRCFERMYKDYVDYILTSFDIFNITEIADHAYGKSAADISGLDGVCYKKDGKWYSNPAKPFDIKRLPRPDRSYFYSHPKNYRYLELEHSAWVRTAYCCPYHCKFCERNRMNSGKYSPRDIEDVVDEIAQIQADNIYIVDDDFLFDEERVGRFIGLLKEKGINKKYICYGRSDFIATHPELIKDFKEVGLYYLLVGLESVDDAHLEIYDKKSSVGYNEKTVEICNNLGVNIMGLFIVDLDYRRKDFKNLYKWIVAHKLKHVAVSIFVPEFGLETYKQYKDRIITDNPSHFDYLHVVAKPTYLSVRKYYFYYYILLIKLFLKAKREGVYDFIDYGDYIRSFVSNMFRKRKNDDE
ncbi:radical SAM protein [Butyrivibrio sp. X503]|uniref:B12-binding domain-containing radical SAM protein n=1 Tax=Butyrivibrio sp. X503 TaxID=2364878 RepID=UPI000EA9546C|nr:radical SAM protein [Butyrivibrio sp. X503]RKM56352.1 radical SAM protein [Butyrivibrio sp. X503]